MSTDIKLSKAQLSKIIQSGEFLRNMLGNFSKKVKDLAILLPTSNAPGLASNIALNTINQFERKISGKTAVRAAKGFTLFILNEDMNDIINDIIKIIKNHYKN